MRRICFVCSLMASCALSALLIMASSLSSCPSIMTRLAALAAATSAAVGGGIGLGCRCTGCSAGTSMPPPLALLGTSMDALAVPLKLPPRVKMFVRLPHALCLKRFKRCCVLDNMLFSSSSLPLAPCSDSSCCTSSCNWSRLSMSFFEVSPATLSLNMLIKNQKTYGCLGGLLFSQLLFQAFLALTLKFISIRRLHTKQFGSLALLLIAAVRLRHDLGLCFLAATNQHQLHTSIFEMCERRM